MRKAIAIEFDGCLCTNAYPEIGEPNWPVIKRAQAEQRAGAECSPPVCIRPSTARSARNLRPDMSQGSAGCTSRKQVQFGTKRNQTKTPNVWDFEVIHNTEGLVS